MDWLCSYIFLWKKVVHKIPSKNNVWNTKQEAPRLDAKYINVFFVSPESITNKNNKIDAIPTQYNADTTYTQSKEWPDLIYLNVKSIHRLDGIRINKYTICNDQEGNLFKNIVFFKSTLTKKLYVKKKYPIADINIKDTIKDLKTSGTPPHNFKLKSGFLVTPL